MVSGISGAINSNFIKTLQRLNESASSQGQSKTSVLSGDSADFRGTLRSGAATYTLVISNINKVASAVNVARDTLTKADEIISEAERLAKRAADPGVSSSTRNTLSRQFRRLGKEFSDLLDEKVGKTEVLDVSQLKDAFAKIGLKPEQSDDIKTLFEAFETAKNDTFLASDKVKGERPLRMPIDPQTGLPIQRPSEVSSLFSSTSSIRTRSEAVRALTDVHALRDQIKTNLESAGNAVQTLADNIEMVRITALAFLDLSNTIDSNVTANDVARELQIEIRKNAKQAVLAQAGNLQPITEANITLGRDNPLGGT